MDLDEVVGRELYEMYRESHEDPEFPTWDEAPTYDWEDEYDEAGEKVDIDTHAHWIAQGRRVNERITAWHREEYQKELERLAHLHDNCVPGEGCKSDRSYLCHCSRGHTWKSGDLPEAHSHK